MNRARYAISATKAVDTLLRECSEFEPHSSVSRRLLRQARDAAAVLQGLIELAQGEQNTHRAQLRRNLTRQARAAA